MDLNTVQIMAIEYLSIVLTAFLLYKCAFLKKDYMDYYLRFVTVLMVHVLVNVPVRLIDLKLVTWPRAVVFWLNAATVILMTFCCAFWCLFVMKQLSSVLVSTIFRIYLLMIPAVAVIPLCIANYWTGWLYSVDEDSRYVRGSLVLQSVVSVVYIILLFICTLQRLIAKKDIQIVKHCFMSLAPVFVCIALQVFFGGSYVIIGMVLCALIMYTEICLSRQKAYEVAEEVRVINNQLLHSNREIASNMRTIIAISDIYDALYEIDLKNDTFSEIKAPMYISRFCGQFSSARELVEQMAGAAFTDEYVDRMKVVFDLDGVDQLFENRNSYYADAVAKHSEKWMRTTMVVTDRDADGKVTNVVLSFQEIEDVIEQQKKIEEAEKNERYAQEMKELFVQTADALASAIDAKDKYTHGHSNRVAEYSRKIAELYGMDETECEKLYFAGLLHDVGKIGIPDTIICKEGKLTDDEYHAIKQHPVFGNTILEKINKLPYLSVGAKYHHERYDGKGYPAGLAGNDIPEMARIIAVADAYDAMTSRRSYRSPMAQQKVREELVKGFGTQFDPKFAMLMVHLIDRDIEYKLKDDTLRYNEAVDRYEIGAYKELCTDGVMISDCITRISFKYDRTDDTKPGAPAIIIFDSLDNLVYTDEAYIRKMEYTGFCEILFDGSVTKGQIRDYITKEYQNTGENRPAENEAVVETVRERDHLLIKIYTADSVREYTIAMWDRAQFAFISITGENCVISDYDIFIRGEQIQDGYIERIADEISYIEGRPEGDFKNLEITGWRQSHSEGALINGELDAHFHTMSLPSARRLWHCPFAIIYYSEDGEVRGKGYREFALIRFNGESWEEDEKATNRTWVTFDESFLDWDKWKADNHSGADCTISIKKEDNRVILHGTNAGVHVENVTTIDDKVPALYFALTGDQVAITNIHIGRL